MPKKGSIYSMGKPEEPKKQRPALTPEAKENQMISLAMDLAEQQLREGTASSQVIAHFLKLASTKDKLEQEILEKQKQLLEAKTNQIKDSKNNESIAQAALDAMREYSGRRKDED